MNLQLIHFLRQSNGPANDEQSRYDANSHHVQPANAGLDAKKPGNFSHAQQSRIVTTNDGISKKSGDVARGKKLKI